MFSKTVLPVVTLLSLGATADARVLLSRDQAMDLAFPGHVRVQKETVFITRGQREAIEQRARGRLDSELMRFYHAYGRDGLIGYAVIDTRRIRTASGTLMTVLSPRGHVLAVHVLAFHEPYDYLPSPRWLAQFIHRRDAEELRVGHGVDGVSGATLTARSAAASVRHALAVYATIIAPTGS